MQADVIEADVMKADVVKDEARERIRRARVALDHAEQQLAPRNWRQVLGNAPLPALIAGGLLGGFVLGALSPKWWSRAGAALFGSGARLARSPFGPPIFAALWTTILLPPRRPVARPASVSAAAPAGA